LHYEQGREESRHGTIPLKLTTNDYKINLGENVALHYFFTVRSEQPACRHLNKTEQNRVEQKSAASPCTAPHRTILRHVSLTVREGERIGDNGRGEGQRQRQLQLQQDSVPHMKDEGGRGLDLTFSISKP
jgi:hypothetical protein